MQTSPSFLYPVGRALIGTLFLVSGIFKIMGFTGVMAYMAKAGVPLTETLLLIVIAIEIGAGLTLITSFKAYYGAIVLALFLLPTTFIFHAFWDAEDAAFSGQLTNFLKNLALLGAMLMVIGRERAVRGTKPKAK